MSELFTLLSAVFVVFLAELGDKTMISTAILAFKTGEFALMLIVSTIAFIAANIIPVISAWALRYVTSLWAMRITASALFVIIGIWLLLSHESDTREVGKGILAGFLLVFLSEMGDKTQFTVFSYSLISSEPMLILICSVLGYLLANAIGITVIKRLGKMFSWRKLKIFSGILMILIGVLLLISELFQINPAT